MTTRTAACACGAVTAVCAGEPVRVSVCHCLDCQRRSGSAFSAQARWPEAAVTVTGETRMWEKAGENGSARFSFCPACGATILFEIDALPGLTAIPLGAFADPDFPAPRYSVWEPRKHPWLEITGDVEHN